MSFFNHFIARFICCLFVFAPWLTHAQARNISKLTLETTYSFSEIHASLRDLVDKNNRENYFKDEFFNSMLVKILNDKQFTLKEKVQLFYLMQKKLGYAFLGVNYLPPKQNYFIFHLSKIQVLKTTQEYISKHVSNGDDYLQIADSHQTNDPIIASNALLLASLLNARGTVEKLRTYSKAQTVMQSKNPGIFNHYVCLSASLFPDSVITANLKTNLKTFSQEGFLEDVLCALYSNPNPLASVKSYIQHENNPANDLAIQTALCALNYRVSNATFKASIKALLDDKPVAWKAQLLKKILDDKLPYNYSLTKEDQLNAKVWDGVKISLYNDGVLISNNTLLEFDAN